MREKKTRSAQHEKDIKSYQEGRKGEESIAVKGKRDRCKKGYASFRVKYLPLFNLGRVYGIPDEIGGPLFPYLKYCVRFWLPHLKKDAMELEKVKKRATRIITGLGHLIFEEML